MPVLKFPGQEPDETEVHVFRRHRIVIGKRIFLFIIEALIPVVLFFALRNFTDWFSDDTGILYIIFVILSSVFYLYILLFLYQAWIDYILDLWILTNERIISIELHGLFKRTVSELRIHRIQDVSSEVHGFLPTIFKYGNVSVQTASGEDRFVLSQVPHPDEVARKIMALQEKYVEEIGLPHGEGFEIKKSNEKNEAKPV